MIYSSRSRHRRCSFIQWIAPCARCRRQLNACGRVLGLLFWHLPGDICIHKLQRITTWFDIALYVHTVLNECYVWHLMLTTPYYTKYSGLVLNRLIYANFLWPATHKASFVRLFFSRSNSFCARMMGEGDQRPMARLSRSNGQKIKWKFDEQNPFGR